MLVGRFQDLVAKLLTSNPLDSNHEKINGNNQHFFLVIFKIFSGYSRLKVLVVTEDVFHG